VAADVTWLKDAGLMFDIDEAGRVATVTLARPERRNAMTPRMWQGLARIGSELLPADVRVVVVKGLGPSFCAGIDLRTFTVGGVPDEPPALGPEHDGFEDQVKGYQDGYRWLSKPEIVSIAAVQGHAIGAGFQLALACDLRVLAQNATFCMKEPELGLVPDLRGTKPLVEIVGLPRAIELCLTARTVDAREARELRLAESVVAPDELDAAVARLAADLQKTVTAAARATKELLVRAHANSPDQQAAAERAAQKRLLLGSRPAPAGAPA
jgi:enoyl-CoA hydratase/carnithine racemase